MELKTNVVRPASDRIMYGLIFAITFTAVTRLIVVASRTETGWQTVATCWQDALFGWIGLGHTAVGNEEPSKQAEFWLKEVHRLTLEHSESASVQMGAAWILDPPTVGFMQNHVRQTGVALPPVELDEATVTLAKAGFRKSCRERCLSLAARATKIEPHDVRWWRMRALLLFEGDTLWSGQKFEPRLPDWLEVLDECEEHDPENALYDHLAALQLWNQSASWDWPDDPTWPVGQARLTINDETRYEVGADRFLQGQRKTYLAIGEAGYSAIAEVLDLSKLRKADYTDVALSRLMTFRQSTLLSELWQWQNARADDARQKHNAEQEIVIRRQNLRVYDQAILPAETSALGTLTTFGTLRQGTYEALVKLASESPNLLPKADMDTIRQREESLRTEAATLQRALQQLDSTRELKGSAESLGAIVSAVSRITSAALMIFAAAALLAGRALAKLPSTTPQLGLLRHMLAWAIGCGGTFVLLGMAPAEMISHETQTRVIMDSVWGLALCITAAAVWIVVVLLRRRKLRFRLVTLFGVTTAVAVLAALWPLMDATFAGLTKYPPELWLHAKGWRDVDAEALRTMTKIDAGTWYWATIQWFLHGGLYVGLALSLLIAMAWFMWRSARQSGEGCVNYWTRDVKGRWALLLRFTGRSAFATAVCWLLVYLFVTPDVLRTAEAKFQYQMRYCRNPAAHYTEIVAAEARVASSPHEMQPIRDQVRFGLDGNDAQEIDLNNGQGR